MKNDDRFQARINSKLKEKGNAVLSSMGIKPSHALTIFYTQIIAHGGIPFDLKIPNEELQKTISEAEKGKNLIKFDSVKNALDSMLD